MDKILITGCAGFLGSNITASFLKSNEHLVFGLDDFSNSTFSRLYPQLKNENFEFLDGIYTSIDFPQTDYILHFSGCGDLNLFYQDKYDFIKKELSFLDFILNETLKSGAMLLISLDYQNFDDVIYNQFLNFKQSLILEFSAKNKINTKILKSSEVYGKNFSFEDERFLPLALKNVFLNKDIELKNNEKINLIYFEDYFKTLEYIMFNYVDTEIIELINPIQTTKNDVLNFIISKISSTSKIEILNNEILSKKYEINNNNLLNKFLQTPLTKGLEETIEDFKLRYFI